MTKKVSRFIKLSEKADEQLTWLMQNLFPEKLRQGGFATEQAANLIIERGLDDLYTALVKEL